MTNQQVKTIYNFDYARNLCVEKGLKFNEEVAATADRVFARANLSQEQVNEMQGLWVELVLWMWDRKTYRFLGRLAIAAYFLGFGKRIKNDQSSS